MKKLLVALLLISLSFAFTTEIITNFPTNMTAGNNYTATYHFTMNPDIAYDAVIYIYDANTTVNNLEVNATMNGLNCSYVNMTNLAQIIPSGSFDGVRYCSDVTKSNENYPTITLTLNPYLVASNYSIQTQFGSAQDVYIAPAPAPRQYYSGSGGGSRSYSSYNPPVKNQTVKNETTTEPNKPVDKPVIEPEKPIQTPIETTKPTENNQSWWNSTVINTTNETLPIPTISTPQPPIDGIGLIFDMAIVVVILAIGGIAYVIVNKPKILQENVKINVEEPKP